jgi:hypothetical protein
MPAFQRVIKFAKVTALVSAAWTILCAVLLVGWWASSGSAYRVSSAIQLLGPDGTDVTGTSETEWTLKETLIDWLLGLPVIAPLLIVAALLVVFYRWLVAIEKREFGDSAGQ